MREGVQKFHGTFDIHLGQEWCEDLGDRSSDIQQKGATACVPTTCPLCLAIFGYNPSGNHGVTRANALAGLALRPPDNAKLARVYDRRDTDARPRHRREHGDLLGGEHVSPSALAVP
jgi:hypothetical protein